MPSTAIHVVIPGPNLTSNCLFSILSSFGKLYVLISILVKH
jgi:hypothetical protein